MISMKTKFSENEYFLPLSLIVAAAFITNMGAINLKVFSTALVPILVFVHLFVLHKSENFENVPVRKIAEYIFYYLIFNGIFCVVSSYISLRSLSMAVHVSIYNLGHAGLLTMFLGFIILTFLGRIGKSEDEYVNPKDEKKESANVIAASALIMLIVFLMYIINNKNVVEIITGTLVVLPYAWYTFNLASKLD